jgi:hypothetical protein
MVALDTTHKADVRSARRLEESDPAAAHRPYVPNVIVLGRAPARSTRALKPPGCYWDAWREADAGRGEGRVYKKARGAPTPPTVPLAPRRAAPPLLALGRSASLGRLIRSLDQTRLSSPYAPLTPRQEDSALPTAEAVGSRVAHERKGGERKGRPTTALASMSPPNSSVNHVGGFARDLADPPGRTLLFS